jgi:hypothetical protein
MDGKTHRPVKEIQGDISDVKAGIEVGTEDEVEMLKKLLPTLEKELSDAKAHHAGKEAKEKAEKESKEAAAKAEKDKRSAKRARKYLPKAGKKGINEDDEEQEVGKGFKLKKVGKSGNAWVMHVEGTGHAHDFEFQKESEGKFTVVCVTKEKKSFPTLGEAVAYAVAQMEKGVIGDKMAEARRRKERRKKLAKHPVTPAETIKDARSAVENKLEDKKPTRAQFDAMVKQYLELGAMIRKWAKELGFKIPKVKKMASGGDVKRNTRTFVVFFIGHAEVDGMGEAIELAKRRDDVNYIVEIDERKLPEDVTVEDAIYAREDGAITRTTSW